MKIKPVKIFVAALAMLCAAPCLTAQPTQKYVRVRVAPQHADWNYTQGEKIKFDVSVAKDDVLLENVDIRYEISEDMMPPLKTGTLTLRDGTATIDAGKMDKPGFLRCRVWASYAGKEYEGIATAGVDPQLIEPTVPEPDDFDAFWDAAKAELARVQMEPVLTLLPERCTSKVDVYQLSLLLPHNARVYGILTRPKAEGKYPALLQVPGAGIRPYYGDIASAEQGFIVLQIGIHGIPVTLPQHVYEDLARGALNNYMAIKLDDKDNYYYKRVYQGCIRSVDYLTSLADWDGRNMIVRGGSQGGALSIVTAGLDGRITGLAADYPAMADMTGYLHGRAGGWPHMFRNESERRCGHKIGTLGYYDVVNFARRVTAPGIYALGYNDMVCPPTSMFSAINKIGAPKDMFVSPEIGHWTYPEQRDASWKWILKTVGK